MKKTTLLLLCALAILFAPFAHAADQPPLRWAAATDSSPPMQ